MGKILMRTHPALQVSWLRYASALAAVLVLLWLLRGRAELSSRKEVKQNFPWIFAMGLTTFFGSAVLQYKGLSLSTSTANAIIVALEPLFAVLLAWVFLGESLRWRQTIAFAAAIFGFCLLSNIQPGDLAASLALFNLGNLLILCTMPMEAMYSIISRKLVGRVAPLSLLAVGLACGFAVLTLYVHFSGVGFPFTAPLSGVALAAMLWLGPLGTTLTYIFWTKALQDAPVAAVSLTLFIQPILGAGMGALFLGERLGFWQATGAMLILAGLVLQTWQTIKKGSQ
jgi:drug/metabolite transporter (DMT)-like permease